jgi:hypothetical protein
LRTKPSLAVQARPCGPSAAQQPPGMSSVSELQAQLLALHRELASVRTALQELRAERDRLIRDLGSSEQGRRGLQTKYSSVRFNVWHLAQRGLSGFVAPEEILEQICAETDDSEDDRAWEGGWVP